MTYPELSIGMAITAVLGLALSTFAVAVSTGWKHSEDEHQVRSASMRSVSQIQDSLSEMLCAVQVKVGDAGGSSAYFFCWQKDTWGGSADRKAQLGEMALIEYEPATKTVWLYQVKDAATMTSAEQTTASSENWGDYTDPAVVTYFKSRSMVAARTPLVGGYGTTAEGGTQVLSAQFGAFAANNGKPIASYRLMIGNALSASAASGNVALRAARTPKNL
jgi:hypothetical protein